ncbi:hypothetical protein [Synechococcus sp. RS9916]|uniref:hypothetical protein n=1 Tax=Synechococcus sp. RS9916 TaxID=221359 RepID=UPI001E3CE68C|nr:hypothetical protein [Synechococcus sp. RS9916]
MSLEFCANGIDCVQLVVIVCNRWIQQLNPVFEWRDGAARSVVIEEAGIPTSLFAIAA